ncbi:hypothetical protein NQF87_08420 [Bombella sp. TMW 2.2559]|uniref:Bacteriophage Mu GpT domain-containing protein n=1 Tax=Bombella dulcis TaxID=2967339 RepID=A0ABT3WD26_9PROT|nr:hypothetical protein [Bombella dulcis]MCX5616990.1 hypothetical protein [Bombella dulcis]
MADWKAPLSGFAGSAIDGWAIQRAARQWGIFRRYQDRQPSIAARVLGDDVDNLFGKGPDRILSAAHVETLGINEYSTISKSPQEDGNFSSYNKVYEPFTATVRFICDGSETGSIAENLLPGFVRGILGDGPDTVRRDFVATLAALVKDTNLYFVATPERIYKHANIINYRIERKSDQGINMIVADVALQEVRSTKKTGWVTVRHPQGAQTQNNGSVSPEPQEGTS